MSLINDMLRDLDERKAPERPGHASQDQTVLAPADVQAPKRHPALLPGLVVLSVIGVSWLAASIYQRTAHTVTAEQESTRQSVAEVLNPPVAVTVAPAI